MTEYFHLLTLLTIKKKNSQSHADILLKKQQVEMRSLGKTNKDKNTIFHTYISISQTMHTYI